MLRILLIDDNPADRALAIRALEREFPDLALTEVASASEFEQAIAQGEFDVTVTDYQLRWSNGITVLRSLKAKFPDLPVVMFTNSGSQEIAVEAMKSGLDDYVIKSPSHYIRLPAAIRVALDRLAANRKAASLEVRLQALLDNLEVGVYRLNSEGIFLEANRAFLRLLGLEDVADFSSPQTLASYFAPEVYADLLTKLQRNGETTVREVEIQRADHQTRWVKISKTLTQIGDIHLVDGLVEDISDRKRIELDNTRLYEEAQQANQLKDEFLLTVSHELRTPLNAILGWSTILQKGTVEPKTLAKALATIERNARRQALLVNDIIDVSRIIRNDLRIERVPVDLIPVVDAAIEDAQLLAQDKSIRLEFQADPDVGQVLGDQNRLQQIVSNLLSNAIKFTPNNGTITVTLSRTQSDVQIAIADTGQGISADFLPRIFDRFRQENGSTTRIQGGLGLGLSIVRHLVELHHGTITASSPGLGQGATFIVRLPHLSNVE